MKKGSNFTWNLPWKNYKLQQSTCVEKFNNFRRTRLEILCSKYEKALEILQEAIIANTLCV